jgi:DNA-binding MarR family transcriptional regulator
MSKHNSELKLENQICFPLYATSRLITQQYKPLLDQLGITYPQYLVLLVLWDKDGIPVKEISEKLLLETNTLTPLLKRLEKHDILQRQRSSEDERVVIISLTTKGKALKQRAKDIPNELMLQLDCLNIEEDEIFTLKKILDKLLNAIHHKK